MALFSFPASQKSQAPFCYVSKQSQIMAVTSSLTHSLTRSARLPTFRFSLIIYYETLLIEVHHRCCVTRFPDCYAIGLLLPRSPPPPQPFSQVQGCAEDTLLPMIKCDDVLTKLAALLPIFWLHCSCKYL